MSANGPARRAGGSALFPLAAATLMAAVLLASCGREKSDEVVQDPRPVRTVTVEKRDAGVPIMLTGRIEAEDEVALAFRISGRILENSGKLGDRVRPGQLMARLEPQNELNALRAAQANLAAAQGQLTQARNHFERQDTLLKQGWTTRANHDQADAGAANRAIAGRRRRSAAQDRAGSGRLHRTEGRCAGRRNRNRPARRRGRSGRADDRSGSRARTAATRSSTCRRS